MGGLCSLGWSPEESGLGIMVLQYNGSSVTRFGPNLLFDSLLQLQLVCCIFFIPPESNIVR